MGAALLLDVAAGADELPGGYGVALLQALLALGAVCVLAWAILRWGARRGLGVGVGGGGGRVRVLERVPLEPRRSLYLVRVGERVLLVGAGDGAAPSLLAEIDPAELPPERVPSDGSSFAEVLRRIRGRT